MYNAYIPNEVPKLPLEGESIDTMRTCGDWISDITEVSKWRFVFSGKMDKRRCVIYEENMSAQSEVTNERIYNVRVVMNF